MPMMNVFNSVIISWSDNDLDGLSLYIPGSDAAELMLVTRWRRRPSRCDDVGKWSRLAWIPPPLESRELGQPSLSIKINLQVE